MGVKTYRMSFYADFISELKTQTSKMITNPTINRVLTHVFHKESSSCSDSDTDVINLSNIR